MKNRSPEFRYNEQTSWAAKQLGLMFKMSPIKIDYLIAGYGGRSTQYIIGKPGAFDLTKQLKKDYYVESGRKFQQFYDMKEKNDQDYYDYQHKLRTFKVGERSEIIRLKSKLKVIDDLLGSYNDVDIDKNPQRAEKFRNQILERINKLKNPGATSSVTKDKLTALYNNTIGTPTAEAFSLNPFGKKKDTMTPISEILSPEAFKTPSKAYNITNQVWAEQPGATKVFRKDRW
jgi:hypothetical protein